MENEFTRSDSEDTELYRNGVTFMWAAGRTKAIQKFVEELSYKAGHKCNFAWTAGRAHMDTSREGLSKVMETIRDGKFVNKFIVPYSKESYNDETYFEPLA